MFPTPGAWQRYGLGFLVALAGVLAAAEPLAVLGAAQGRRLGAAPDDGSAPHVLSSGNESVEWDIPAAVVGPCRIEMTVRTGSNDADPLDDVRSYRAWTVAADGSTSEPLEFLPLPGAPPERVPGVWPQWIGEVAGSAPLVLTPGQKLRAACPGVAFAEVRSVRLLPARPEDLLSTSLTCPRPGHLFRLGEAMPLAWRVRSFLPTAATLTASVRLESPYGQTLAEQTLEAATVPGGQVDVPTAFPASLRGPHVAVLTFRHGATTYTAEQALDVVSVPPAAQLDPASPFAVHPASLGELYECGFTWVRLWDTGDVWNRHERAAKGSFDFGATDAKVDRFRAQGLQVLAVLAYTPTWASTRPAESHYTGGGALYPPRDLQDWRDYCREYMTRFRGRIRHYEVWNEPNAGFFQGTADEYLALLRAAFAVAAEVDPQIRIVGGSGTGDFLPWTETLLKAGAGTAMHILSFHAYTTPQSPEEANLEGRLQHLHELTRRYGVPDMPLWNTEAGYWSDRRNGARPASAAELLAKAPAALRPNWSSGWPFRPIPEDDAAAFTVRHYLLNVAGGVERVFWYSSVPTALPLLCEDGGLRYACLAVAHAAERLNGFRFVRRVDLGLSRLHLQIWQRDGETLGVLWHAERGERAVEFPAGEPPLTVTDLWGNPRAAEPQAGPIVLEAGRDPLYLRAPAATLDAARLRTRQLLIPVTECHVVREVSAERPVKEHTSAPHHGERRVFGLPDVGDALAWRLAGIRPGLYDLFVELRTGSAAQPYGGLGTYRVSVVRGTDAEPVDLEPVTETGLLASALATAEGGGRAYGFARAGEAVWLEPGSEVTVEALEAWGFVGSLMLRDAAGGNRVRVLPRLAVRPALDGTLTAVAGLRPLDLSRRRQVVIGVADPFASTAGNDAWRGPDDLSARGWCAAVPEGLYIAVAVTDGGGIFPAANGAYDGDCVEAFLDLRPETQVGSAQTGEGVFQIFVRAPASATRRGCEGRCPAGSEASAVRTPSGWLAEIFVPLPAPAGKLLGLDLAVDDDDTGQGRKSQIVWHGTSQNYQDPSAYGRFAWPPP